jgi:hypothetical protein
MGRDNEGGSYQMAGIAWAKEEKMDTLWCF